MFTTPPEPEVQEPEILNQVPHNADMERALVGAALQSIVVFRSVSEIVADTDFYIHRNRFIWQAIGSCADDDIQPDLLIIQDACARSPWTEVDYPYLAKCLVSASECLFIETAQEYARKIKEFSTRRMMLTMANQLAQNAYDLQRDPGASISESLAFMQGEAVKQPGSRSVSARDASSALYDHTEKLIRSGMAPGIVTNLVDFHKILGGYVRGRSGLVAGRPRMGKTAFILTEIADMNYDLIKNVSRVYKPKIVLNSMEMSTLSIMQRLAAIVARVDSEKIQRGKMSDDELIRFNEAVGEIGSWPLIIIDERDPFVLYSRISQYVAVDKCDILFNDYIGKFEAKAENRVRQVGIASGMMSKIAIQLDIPVVTCAQVSRESDKKDKDYHLVLGDLKETGDLEQDANWVLFLNPDSQNPGVRFCEVAKNRDGRDGDFRLLFQGAFTRFVSASAKIV